MNTCIINFNGEKDQKKDLKDWVDRWINDGLDISLIPNIKKDIISGCENIDTLEKALDEIIENSEITNPDEFKKAILNLFNGENIITDKTDNDDKLKVESVKEAEDTPKVLTRYKDLVNIIFKNQFAAYRYCLRTFDMEFFDAGFIDRKNHRLVSSALDLNSNIIQYKNSLYNKLVEYLILKNPATSYPESMYNDMGQPMISYEKALYDMEEFIETNKDLISDLISSEFREVLKNKDSLFIDAVNAYLKLRFFDTILRNLYGRTISVKSGYTNIEVDLNSFKYLYKRDDSHERKDWNESESKTAMDSTAKFSKVVLDHVPLYLYVNGEYKLLKTKNMGSTHFILSVIKLFNIKYNSDYKGMKTLYKYLSKFKTSPDYYAYKIMQLIYSDSKMRSYLMDAGLLQEDINNIYSVYKYIYDVTDDSSINNLELLALINKVSFGKYMISSDISGLIDNVADLKYLETRVSPNGDTLVSIRNPYNKRKNDLRYKDTVNVSVFNMGLSVLLDKTKHVSIVNAPKSYKVILDKKYGNLSFKITCDSLFKNSLNTKVDSVILENTTIDIDKSFNDWFIKIVNGSNISDLLKEDTKDLNIKAAQNIIKFIDDFLFTGFFNEEGMTKLKYLVQLAELRHFTDAISDLVNFAVRSSLIMGIYADLKEENTPLDLYESKLENRIPFLLNDNNAKKSYLLRSNGIAYYKIIPDSTQWTGLLDEATIIMKGYNYASVSKNVEGNNDANSSTQYLGARIFNIADKARTAQKEVEEFNKQGNTIPRPNTTTNTLLFVQNPSKILKTVVDSGTISKERSSKLTKNFSAQELFYNSIINNFLYSYVRDNSHNIYIQPTTYSDKTKFIAYLLDGKEWMEQTPELLMQAYADTIGIAAKNELENVLYKYNIIFEGEQHFSTINDLNTFLRSKRYSVDLLIALADAKGVRLTLDLDYRKQNGICVPNELLEFNAEMLNIDVVRTRMEESKRQFINMLVASGVNFYIDYYENIALNNRNANYIVAELIKSSNHPIAQIIREFYKTSLERQQYIDKWIDGNKLRILDEDGNLNPLFEKFFYVNSLLANNLRILLTGFETNHPDKSKVWKVYDKVITRINNKLEYPITNDILGSSIELNKLRNSVVWISNNAAYEDNDVVNCNKTNYTIDQINSYVSLGKHLIISSEKLDSLEYSEIKKLQAYTLSKDNDITFDNNFYLSIYSKLINRDLIGLRNITKSANNLVGRQASYVVDLILLIILNFSLSTQLKRNVIIPATSYLVHSKSIRGLGDKIKVAFILDLSAKIFNFTGKIDTEDSMDGSAFITMEQSILENGGLLSQEVGVDKKNIWHHYDFTSGTSGLMKFAAYAINNQRINQSKGSSVSLYNIYKKMTNLQWKEGDVDLTKSLSIGKVRSTLVRLNFLNRILGELKLYYRTYDLNGKPIVKQIIDFGRDKETGTYYTKEAVALPDGNIDNNTIKEVYHSFTSNSDHIISDSPQIAEGNHTINSNFELWLTMGGYNSVDNINDTWVESESSHYAVVGFMNEIMQKPSVATEDRSIISLENYRQPLKDYQIGYLCNNSGMKQGVQNINNVKLWNSDNTDSLHYTELDTDGLGVLMDADHDVAIDAMMKEFSQVITALTAGGYLHENIALAFKVLEVIANNSSTLELQAITKLLLDLLNGDSQSRSDAYDILSRMVIDKVDDTDNKGLANAIIDAVDKGKNKQLNHKDDKEKIPFSDQSIYSLLLPALVGNINAKSIKRPFPGSGCVMVPGYNIMQYYTLQGQPYMFNDILLEALKLDPVKLENETDLDFEKRVVREYMDALQAQIPTSTTTDVFLPTDIVNILDADGKVLTTVNLDDPKIYYKFVDFSKLIDENGDLVNNDITEELKSLMTELGLDYETIHGIKFQLNITLPKNLAPSRITFIQDIPNGKRMCIFDIPAIRENILHPNDENQKNAELAFRDLKRGYYLDENGDKVYIKNLRNLPAECIAPNMYGSKFGVSGKTVAEIRSLGEAAFRIKYTNPILSNSYDMIFSSNDGEDVYISFTRNVDNSTYIPFPNNRKKTVFENGKYNVYYTDLNNTILFKIGEYKKQPTYFLNKDGKIEDKSPEEGTNPIKKGSFKVKDNEVYEYIEFVSLYQVVDSIKDYLGNIIGRLAYTKFYISQNNINLCYNKKTDNKGYSECIRELLDSLYLSKQFIGIKFNNFFNEKFNRDFILTYVANMKSLDYDYRKTVLEPLREKVLELKSIKQENSDNAQQSAKDNKQADIDEKNRQIRIATRKLFNTYYSKMSFQRYSSWELSLYYTAARIPAQSLQSFMQMRCMAYTGGSKNIVYVSHWLTWLQGSI